MKFIERVREILLHPRATWPVIEREAGDSRSIFVDYLVYIAAVPAVAGFIGMSLVGIGGFGRTLRLPVGSGLVQMVAGYLLSLAIVYVTARLVDAIAPAFGGVRSRLNALKVVAYGSTAGFLAGLFSLVPALAWFGVLASLYSVYLLYTGLPVLMKCPPGKAAGFTAVVVLLGIVAMIVLASLSSLLLPAHMMDGMHGRHGGPARTAAAGGAPAFA